MLAIYAWRRIRGTLILDSSSAAAALHVVWRMQDCLQQKRQQVCMPPYCHSTGPQSASLPTHACLPALCGRVMYSYASYPEANVRGLCGYLCRTVAVDVACSFLWCECNINDPQEVQEVGQVQSNTGPCPGVSTTAPLLGWCSMLGLYTYNIQHSVSGIQPAAPVMQEWCWQQHCRRHSACCFRLAILP